MDWVLVGLVAMLAGAAVGLRPYQTALKVSGGTGHDFIAGGGAGDRLNADGSRDRTILSGWNPTITTGAGFSFDEMVSNFGKIRLFGEGDRTVDPAEPVITGAEIGAIFGTAKGSAHPARTAANDNPPICAARAA